MAERNLKFIISVRDDGTVVIKQMEARARGAFRNMGDAAKQTSGSWRGVAAAVSAGAFAAIAAWRGLEAAARAAIAPWQRGIAAIDEIKLSTASLAALITGMARDKSNLAATFQQARRYADQVNEALELWDANTVASAAQLRLMNQQFAAAGVLIDANNQKHKATFVALANAIGTLAQGQNMELQYLQEARAMWDGQVRATSRVATYIDQALRGSGQGGLDKFVEDVRAGRREWTDLLPLLKGFEEGADEIGRTWAATKTNLETIVNRVLRGGMVGAYQDILGWAERLRKAIIDDNGQLTRQGEVLKGTIIEGWKQLSAIMRGIIGIGEKAWNAWSWLYEKVAGPPAPPMASSETFWARRDDLVRRIEAEEKYFADLTAGKAGPKRDGLILKWLAEDPNVLRQKSLDRIVALRTGLWEMDKAIQEMVPEEVVTPEVKPGGKGGDDTLKKLAKDLAAWREEELRNNERFYQADLLAAEAWRKEQLEAYKGNAQAREQIEATYLSKVDAARKKHLGEVADDLVAEVRLWDKYAQALQRTADDMVSEMREETWEMRQAERFQEGMREQAEQAADAWADSFHDFFVELSDETKSWGDLMRNLARSLKYTLFEQFFQPVSQGLGQFMAPVTQAFWGPQAVKAEGGGYLIPAEGGGYTWQAEAPAAGMSGVAGQMGMAGAGSWAASKLGWLSTPLWGDKVIGFGPSLGGLFAAGGLGFMGGSLLAPLIFGQGAGTYWGGGAGGAAGAMAGLALGGVPGAILGGLAGMLFGGGIGSLFGESEAERKKKAMRKSVRAAEDAYQTLLDDLRRAGFAGYRETVGAETRTFWNGPWDYWNEAVLGIKAPVERTRREAWAIGASERFAGTGPYGALTEAEQESMAAWLEEVMQKAAALYETAAQMTAQGLADAFTQPDAVSAVDVFGLSLQTSVFQAVDQGLAAAFMNTEVLKTRMMPLMQLIDETFAPEKAWGAEMQWGIEAIMAQAKKIADSPEVQALVSTIWQVRQTLGATYGYFSPLGGSQVPALRMAEGGVITEPIYGVGRSGRRYLLGEQGPETVTPGVGGQGDVHIHLEGAVISDDMSAQKLARTIRVELERINRRIHG